jgi:hypothetical protein
MDDERSSIAARTFLGVVNFLILPNSGVKITVCFVEVNLCAPKMAKRNLKCLSLEEKYLLITEAEKGEKKIEAIAA